MRTKRIDEIELYIREKNLSLLIRCAKYLMYQRTQSEEISQLLNSLGRSRKFMGALRSQIFLPQRCCFLFPHAIKA